MIVKNEKDVICRCLGSTKPLIDYWVIVDTGSTDGTQDIIKEFLKDIPGELHEYPWKNFSYNRTQALELAKGKADYILIIDADDEFEYPENFQWPDLKADGYFMQIRDCGIKYDRLHLVNNHIPWKWVGVLHEYICCDQAKTYAKLDSIAYHRIGGGDRSKDPTRYLKDAKILEEALLEEPDNSRYVFYLAQSYHDARDFEKSIEVYEKRTKMGGWADEIFWSKFQIALMKDQLNKDENEVIAAYEDAYRSSPIRAEPLFGLTCFYHRKENYEAAYKTALKGLHLKMPPTALFAVDWIYSYGLALEFSICAFYAGKYTESWLAARMLLNQPNLPKNVHDTIVQNLQTWMNPKMIEQAQILSSAAE